ncbi:formate dehydrogenase accessory protein FdhE [Sutterella sp.]|uniref:formate dehydrogenase accessory protein FdhE n=1 Tax=Sutterella sp. TaxID=1981025 RepID=UPI0026DF7658|nr:formate dehydrogenase accessory protein FdhE [Sutterella sp.]MDO5531562.1 formate dehydrogenase accessory protein FdhE [Sutterella sp.]
MTPKSIERALARYRAYKDEDVRSRLAIYGPLLLETATLANSLTDQDVTVVREPTEDELLAAAKGGPAILAFGMIKITPASFARDLKRLGAVLLDSMKADDAFRAKAAAFDWAPLSDDDFLFGAEADPVSAYDEVIALTESTDEVLRDAWVLPVISMTLRAYFDRFAREASARLETKEEKSPSFTRRTTCFCCGSEPDVAAVASTTNRGNVKKLYCGVCGASWSFERIRCARCGDDIVSNLSYISDESDDNHRLHICAACHAAMPTLFAPGDELTFNPDVEGIVLTGLEEAYDEAVTAGTVPQKVLKQGDATMGGAAPGKGNY